MTEIGKQVIDLVEKKNVKNLLLFAGARHGH